MKFQIKNRWTDAVQFDCELTAEAAGQSYSLQLGFAVKKAIEADADLRRANLSDANLSDADLRRANLSDADLSDADLRRANLSDADLRRANLSDADLSDANLSDADLSDANLRRADLRRADLSDANLSDANLSDANLSDANLSDAKEDFFARLSLAKNEALGLYDYLMKGKIDGSSYEGECACFCGTVARVREEYYEKMTNGLEPDADSPTERLFYAIKQGDIPQNNQVSAIVASWMREFMDKEGIIYPQYEIAAI